MSGKHCPVQGFMGRHCENLGLDAAIERLNLMGMKHLVRMRHLQGVRVIFVLSV